MEVWFWRMYVIRGGRGNWERVLAKISVPLILEPSF